MLVSRRALALSLCLFATSALANNPYLDEGRRLYGELRYAAATEKLLLAKRVTGASSEERRETLDLLGRCQVIQGQRGAAELTFGDLLRAFPDATLDRSLSPKILEVFNAVKEEIYPKDYVRLLPLPAAVDGERLRLVDPWNRTTRVILEPLGGSEPRELQQRGTVIAFVPEASERRSGYFIRALDAEGNTVAQERRAPVLAPAPERAASPARLVETTPLKPAHSVAQRRAAYVVGAAAVLAGVAGGVLQVSALQANEAARAESFADNGRALHAKAVTQAQWATGLFIGAGVAGATAVALFVW